MNVSLIVACARNAVIGVRGSLPWRLSEDLRNFKRTTLNKTVVMGRKTWLSLPLRPLPQRRNIVLSRNASFIASGAEVTNSVEHLSELIGGEECIAIGGVQVYQHFLPLVKTIYLTIVAVESKGDLFFPKLNIDEWDSLSHRHHTRDENNEFDMDFIVLRRRAGSNKTFLARSTKPFFPAMIQAISGEGPAPLFPDATCVNRDNPWLTDKS